MKILDVEIKPVGRERDKQISDVKGLNHKLDDDKAHLECIRCHKK